jgi:hypothetical protein
MAETIVVFLIAGIAVMIAVRWFYRTVAGKSEGCGCSQSACPNISSCDAASSSNNHCKEIRIS